MSGAVSKLPLLDDVVAEMQERMRQDLAAIGWTPNADKPHRWGDPIEVGDRVKLTLAFITSTMLPIGYVSDRTNPVYGGVAATSAGTVRSLGEPLPFLAVVEWDDGYVQTLAVGNLIQLDLLQHEAIRWHAGMLS